jgi:hypothetical protein
MQPLASLFYSIQESFRFLVINQSYLGESARRHVVETLCMIIDNATQAKYSSILILSDSAIVLTIPARRLLT